MCGGDEFATCAADIGKYNISPIVHSTAATARSGIALTYPVITNPDPNTRKPIDITVRVGWRRVNVVSGSSVRQIRAPFSDSMRPKVPLEYPYALSCNGYAATCCMNTIEPMKVAPRKRR